MRPSLAHEASCLAPSFPPPPSGKHLKLAIDIDSCSLQPSAGRMSPAGCDTLSPPTPSPLVPLPKQPSDVARLTATSVTTDAHLAGLDPAFPPQLPTSNRTTPQTKTAGSYNGGSAFSPSQMAARGGSGSSDLMGLWPAAAPGTIPDDHCSMLVSPRALNRPSAPSHPSRSGSVSAVSSSRPGAHIQHSKSLQGPALSVDVSTQPGMLSPLSPLSPRATPPRPPPKQQHTRKASGVLNAVLAAHGCGSSAPSTPLACNAAVAPPRPRSSGLASSFEGNPVAFMLTNIVAVAQHQAANSSFGGRRHSGRASLPTRVAAAAGIAFPRSHMLPTSSRSTGGCVPSTGGKPVAGSLRHAVSVQSQPRPCSDVEDCNATFPPPGFAGHSPVMTSSVPARLGGGSQHGRPQVPASPKVRISGFAVASPASPQARSQLSRSLHHAPTAPTTQLQELAFLCHASLTTGSDPYQRQGSNLQGGGSNVLVGRGSGSIIGAGAVSAPMAGPWATTKGSSPVTNAAARSGSRAAGQGSIELLSYTAHCAYEAPCAYVDLAAGAISSGPDQRQIARLVGGERPDSAKAGAARAVCAVDM